MLDCSMFMTHNEYKNNFNSHPTWLFCETWSNFAFKRVRTSLLILRTCPITQDCSAALSHLKLFLTSKKSHMQDARAMVAKSKRSVDGNSIFCSMINFLIGQRTVCLSQHNQSIFTYFHKLDSPVCLIWVETNENCLLKKDTLPTTLFYGIS